MRIACFELEPWERTIFETAFPEGATQCYEEPLREEHLAELQECEVLSVFIYSPVTRAVIERLPKLKLICTMSTGYDHIDVAACKERNIAVCTVPTYGERTVAQHTYALLLALTHKLPQCVEEVKKGHFIPTPALRGRDIDGKTLGVIGTGKIGSNVIAIANGFRLRVIAYDPFPNPDLETQLNFRYVSLDELYAASDIVTVHVPLNEHTKHLINAEAIAKMKQGVIILNTSRGGIIETEPLFKALQSGHVGGAGLDVLEEETAIKEEKQLLSGSYTPDVDYRTALLNHLLIQHPNCLVTPHNAFNSQEALERIIRTTIENIQSFAKGEPKNLVRT
jgi:D-lactate dehydrogenase